MNIILGIIIGLVILMLLVVAHEFGHYIMARRNGVRVLEFGIGFPPRAIAWIRNPEWEKGKKGVKKWIRLPKSEWDKPQKTMIFSFNWLPIGGFCSMDGESAADKRKGTFGATSFWNKTKILFGGVLMNWIVAFIILTILAFTGMPQFIEHQFYLGNDAQIIGEGVTVVNVIEDSPAAHAGFQEGDQIIKIEDTDVMYPTDVTVYGQNHAGENVKYHVLRTETVQPECTQAPCEEQTHLAEKELTARLNPEGSEYTLGVSMSYGQTFIKSTWSAPVVGLGTTIQLTGETFRGLGEMVWNLISGVARQFSPNDTTREAGQNAISAAGDAVSGPIGIIGIIFPAFASSGISNLAFLAALISISLACMNVLPIPALDGGRWLLIAIYKLRRKPLSKETEEKIVSRAFMILIILIIFISILDITRFF